MCCTTSKQPGKSSGSWENKYCNAFGPPVEIPMATMREGHCGMVVRRGGLRLVEGTVMIIFGTPEEAATLILIDSSAGICSMCPEAASCGLVTKSKAPSDRAFSVSEALWVVCVLTTITGT